MTRPDRMRSAGRYRGAPRLWSRSAAASEAGFTLVEVLLVVVITALVLAAVVPLSATLIERADEKAVVDRLSAGVRLATADAARRGAIVTLCVRERGGAGADGADLVLQFPSAVGGGAAGDAAAEHVVELGVDMPRGWRVESAVELERPAGPAAPPGGESAAAVTLTPLGTAFPDGRFVCLAVVATTGPRGAVTREGAGDVQEDAPAPAPRLAVTVDALSGHVRVSVVEGEKKGAAEPGAAAPPPPLPATGTGTRGSEPAAAGGGR